jgi:hypothetical protein
MDGDRANLELNINVFSSQLHCQHKRLEPRFIIQLGPCARQGGQDGAPRCQRCGGGQLRCHLAGRPRRRRHANERPRPHNGGGGPGHCRHQNRHGHPGEAGRGESQRVEAAGAAAKVGEVSRRKVPMAVPHRAATDSGPAGATIDWIVRFSHLHSLLYYVVLQIKDQLGLDCLDQLIIKDKIHTSETVLS